MFITVADYTAVNKAGFLEQQSPAELAAAVAYANDVAASHLARQYRLPLPAVPESVKGACIDIVRRRVAVHDMSEGIEKAHTDAMRYLRDLANGVAVLVLADDPSTPENEAGARKYVFSGGERRIYSRAALGTANRSGEW